MLQTSDRRHHRDRDEDRKRDRINGEDKHRRHRDDDSGTVLKNLFQQFIKKTTKMYFPLLYELS